MALPLLPVAAVYVALHTLLLLALAILVVRERLRHRVALGDGGNPAVLRATRIHGNAIEQAAPTMAILILMALLAAPAWALHLFGVSTLLARVLHASGLTSSAGPSLGRQVGMLMTWSALGLGSIGLLVLALR